MTISELPCIYSALILHNDEVVVTAQSSVNTSSRICNVGVGGPAPAVTGAAPTGGAAPASIAAPAEEKKEEAKKEESEEFDDAMGFGLFN
ncbi:60S acidic ribosomal protein P1-like isoform X2 [Vombatus ursinus]|uniref:60S acidic ribosomal protein P1-like isoform X2 n=1 Tax=Vombatus ursinus TaxID=29139 RepID=UPI000FFDA13C|nr:60S acidic ribosomal protein P1-like isoform X2 [Vombatus ursinus]